MKLLHHSQEFTVTGDVTLLVRSETNISMKGPGRTINRSFRHLKVEMKSTGPQTVRVFMLDDEVDLEEIENDLKQINLVSFCRYYLLNDL